MSILDTSPEVAPRGAVPLILLDADYLAYRIGGISQAKDRDPSIDDQSFECVDEATDKHVWVDPWELVKWRVDNDIDKIKDTLGTDSVEVWLTPHSGNFRVHVAVTKPYKGGRTSIRPYHYRNIRDYLVEEYGAQLADQCEADDMVCTRQMECMTTGVKSVICGPDKDLKCMFGDHYNPVKEEREWITWEQAALNFYGQMIVGDTVDNIPGCKRKGAAYLKKMMSDLDGLTGNAPVDEVHYRVAEAYKSSGHDVGYQLEQADLLHMRRFLDEKWSFDYNWEHGYVDQH